MSAREPEGARSGESLGASFSRQTLAGFYRATAAGELLDCNEAFARILGWPDRATLLAAGANDLFGEPAEHAARLARLRQAPAPGRNELALTRRDGQAAWVAASESIALDGDGREVVEGAVVDVTDRRQMEARLLQAERLASVGTLAAGVAHEVNNPLSYVIANLGYAQEQVAAAGDSFRTRGAVHECALLDQAMEALLEARQGAERVRAIVRDLRMYARAEDERKTLLDLGAVAESALGVLRDEISSRARVVRSFRASPPVLAPEGRLGQVFLNLLSNAVQALPEGDPAHGEIRVGVEPVGSGKVLVEVEDNGTGMDPEVAGRAFEPFFTTRGGKATGLGLPICRAVVASLGGEITLDTAKGRGTRVRVILPTAEAHPVRRDLAGAELGPADSGARRVLVVDDDPVVGQAVRRLLGGNEVVLCSESQRALELLSRDRSFDVILCDLFMPVTSGMDFYRTLLAQDPETASRVTFISAGAYTEETSEFLDAVPNRCMEKPFDAARLRALVSRTPKRR